MMPKDDVMGRIILRVDTIRKRRHLHATPCIVSHWPHREVVFEKKKKKNI